MEVAGSSVIKVDAKGRVFLPRRYLETVDEEEGTRLVVTSYWLTPGLDGCLWLLDKNEWRRMQRRLRIMDIGSAELRRVQRFFFQHTERTKLDAQGRILLPESHRRLAEITDQVQVLGMVRRIEIWSPTVYGSYGAGAETNWTQLLEAVLSGEDEGM
ncbi:MAG: division/cell wall cluster transcriptional repressor MraZ [Planctomycetota bacterium]